MTARIIPEPGWVAMKLLGGGTPMALCLLGLAVTLADGKAGDDEISEAYALLANDPDPVFTVNSYYMELEGDHPYLIGWLDPLTAWMQQPAPHQYDQLSDYAALLSTVSFVGLEQRAGGELFGPVLAHFQTSGHRRSKVFDFTPRDLASLEALSTPYLRKLGNFTDAWCGVGTRVLGIVQALELLGRDPNEISWSLNDPNRLALACAGLNCASVGLRTVHLADSPDLSLAYAAAGRGLHVLPPEEVLTVQSKISG